MSAFKGPAERVALRLMIWPLAMFALGAAWVLMTLGLVGGSVPEAPSKPWGKDYLPNVDVVDHLDRSHRFYDDLIAGKIVVISFVYTSCKSICPLVISRLREVQARLGEHMGRDIHFISVSIDPVPDTPQMLNKQAKAFAIAPGWLFLTGKMQNIDQIREKLGERSGQVIAQHKNEILMYNDATGQWARDSAFSDLGVLTSNIRSMDPAYLGINNEQHIAAAKATDAVAHLDRPGQALFIKACATCHTVGGGDKVGPDLAGVKARRGADWVTSYLKSPDRLRNAGDATALLLRERYPDVRMPTLGISDDDASDLISYIEARTAAPVKATQAR